MKTIRPRLCLTVVKIVSIVLLSANVFAQTKKPGELPDTEALARNAETLKKMGKELQERAEKCEADGTSEWQESAFGGRCIPNGKLTSECRDLSKTLEQKENEMKKTCVEAGFKVGNCLEIHNKCTEERSESGLFDMNTMSQLTSQMLPMFGMPAINLPVTNGPKCPTRGATDYFDRKDKLTKEISETQKEMAELEKDIAEEKSKTDDKMQDAQEKVTRAQKDLNDKKQEVGEQKIKATAEAKERQAQKANEVRELNAKLLTHQGDMAKADREFMMQLTASNDRLNNLKCLAQVKQARDKMMEMGIYSQTEGRQQLERQVELKASLQAQFDACISIEKQQRIKLMEDHSNRMKSMQNTYRSLQETTDESHKSLAAAETSMNETIKNLDESLQGAQKGLMSEMQTAQTAMSNANTNMQSRQNAIRAKQTAAQAKLAKLQQDLSKLGPEPEPGTKTGWRDADSAVSVFLSSAMNYTAKCCPKGSEKKDRYCKNTSDYQKRVNQRNAKDNESSDDVGSR